MGKRIVSPNTQDGSKKIGNGSTVQPLTQRKMIKLC